MFVEPQGFLQLVLVHKCMQLGPEGVVAEPEIPI